MAKKSKSAASRKSKTKVGKQKAVAKKTARKTYGVKAADALARAASERTKAATNSGRTIVRKAIKAIAAVAAPILPHRESK